MTTKVNTPQDTDLLAKMPFPAALFKLQDDRNVGVASLVHANDAFSREVCLDDAFSPIVLKEIFPDLPNQIFLKAGLLDQKADFQGEVFLPGRNLYASIRLSFSQKPFFYLFITSVSSQNNASLKGMLDDDLFSLSFELSGEAVRIVGLDYKIVKVNKKYASFYNMKPADIEGRFCYEFLCSDKCGDDQCNLKLFIKGGQFIDDDADYIVNGQKKHFHYTVLPVKDKQEKLLGIMEQFRDMTDFQNKKKALEESEEKLRILFEYSGLGIILADPDGKVYYANPAFASMLGEPVEGISGKTLDQMVPQKDLLKEKELIRQVKVGEISQYQLEKKLIRASKEYIWVRVSVSAYRGNDHELRYFVVMIENIHNKKMAEQALKQTERRIGASFNNAVAGMIIADSHQNILHANTKWQKMTGYTMAELRAKKLNELTEDDHAKMNQKINGELINRKKYFRKDGSSFWGLLHLSPVFDDDGSIDHLMAVIVDVSREEENKQKLRAEVDNNFLIADISSSILSRSYPMDKVLKIINNIALKITGAEHGFIRIKNPLRKNQFIVDSTKTGNGSLARFMVPLYKFKQIRIESEPHGLIKNDLVLQSKKHSLAFKSLIYLPVVLNGEEAGQIVIADKNKVLTDKDLFTLRRLLNILFFALMRNQYEDQLVQAKNYYLTIFDDFPAMVWRSDVQGSYDYFNQTWLKFTGFNHKEQLGKGKEELIHPHDRGIYRQAFDKAMRHRHFFEVEYRLIGLHGQYHWVIDRGKPFFALDGKFNGFIGACYDNDARRKAEEEVRKSEQLLKQVFEDTPAGMRLVKDGVVLMANERYAAYNDLKASQLVGRPCDDFLCSNDCGPGCGYQSLVDSNDKLEGHLTVKRKNRADIELEYKTQMLRDENENILGMLQVFWDNTEQKKNEKALRKSEMRFRTYIESSPLPIFIIHKDDHITYFNHEASRMLGYSIRELAELSFPQLIAENDEPLLKKWFADGRFSGNVKMVSAKNDLVDVKIDAVTIEDDRLLMFCEDITDKKVTEEQLRLYQDHLEYLVQERTRKLSVSEAKFRNIFNALQVSIVITSEKDEVLESNSMAQQLLNLPPVMKGGLKLMDIIVDEVAPLVYRKYINEIRDGLTRQMSFKMQGHDKKIIYFEMEGRAINIGNQTVMLHIIRDVTERKQMQKRILKTIFETEEKERKRFAKDLHDGLGAILSGIKLHLSLLESNEVPPEDIPPIVQRSKELVSQAASSAREIANNIKPHDLSDFGLVSSVESFLEKIRDVSGINIDFNARNFKVQLDDDIELIIFRIVNELINNTIKYAQAVNIRLVLSGFDQKVIFLYSDDGNGFDYQEVISRDEGGMGLKNIISRVESINGICEINGVPGSGMDVVIELNLND